MADEAFKGRFIRWIEEIFHKTNQIILSPHHQIKCEKFPNLQMNYVDIYLETGDTVRK